MTGRALTAAVGVMVAGVLPAFLAASLNRRIDDEIAFGASTLGVAVAAFHAVSAIAAPSFGRVVARVGAPRALQVCCTISIACDVAITLAVESAAALVTVVAVAGVANGGAGPAASALLRAAVDPGRSGVAFGAQLAGAPLGVLLAGLAVPLVAAPLGWRWAFVVAALVAAAAAAAAPRVPSGAARGRVRAAPAPCLLYLLAVAAAFANAAGTGVLAFLVVFATDAGIDDASAGLLLSAVSLAAVVSRVGVGVSADRRAGDALAAAVPLLCAGAAGSLLLVPAEPALIVTGALLVGGLGWAWPGLFTLAVVAKLPESPARAVGIMMSGLFAGAVAGPLLVGALASRSSYEAAWIACAGSSLVAVALVRSARQRRIGEPAIPSAHRA